MQWFLEVLLWLRDQVLDYGPWVRAAEIVFAALGIFFSVVIYPIWRWIKRIILRGKGYKKLYEAEVERADEPPDPAQPGATADNWEKLRKTWLSARERAEQAILNLHGNARGAYEHLTRYNYQAVAEQLNRHRVLSIEGAAALRELDRLALGRRRARAATGDEVERAKGLYKILDKELPPVEGED